MEDLTALAVRLSQTVGDAHGVLILSRDGLVLGAHPADAEQRCKVPWLRFAALGEPERGFVQFGGEIWSYVRRGAYAGFVVSGPGVRPGYVLDQIEIALLQAEEARLRREGLRPEAPAPPVAPLGKPRSPLHPEVRPEPPVVIRAGAAPPGETATVELAEASGPPGPASEPEGGPRPVEAAPAAGPLETSGAAPSPADAPPPAETPAGGPEPPAPPATPAAVWGGPAEEPEEGEGTDEAIDRFALVREFSKLLQEGDEGADG